MSRSIFSRARAAVSAGGVIALAVLLSGANTASVLTACDNTWHQRPAPGAVPLRDVAATGPNHVWVAGEGDFAAHESFGQWTVDRLPAGVHIERLAAVEAFTWAIGTTDVGTPLVLRWRAGRWHIVKSFTVDTVRLRSIAVNRDHQVWISGEAVAADESTRPLAVWFDGSQWRRHIFAAAGSARGVDSVSASRTMVVGLNADYRNVSWRWDGSSWRRQFIFSPDDEDFYYPAVLEVALGAGGRAYAASIYDEGDCCHTDILASRYVRGSWRTPASVFGSPFDIVASSDGSSATIVGDDFHGDGGGGIYAGVVYAWDGRHWVRQPVQGLSDADAWNIYGVDADSTGALWLAGAAPGRTPLLARVCNSFGG